MRMIMLLLLGDFQDSSYFRVERLKYFAIMLNIWILLLCEVISGFFRTATTSCSFIVSVEYVSRDR